MIIWLASYPRSGNTFLRVLLHRLFGLSTHSIYSVADDLSKAPTDTHSLMCLIGQTEAICNTERLGAGSLAHFVKTHEMPNGDNFPAIVLIRDGRDAMVSYTHFILKVKCGIEQPTRDLFERVLENVIRGEHFGGWSKNVDAWIRRTGQNYLIRFEDLIEDPAGVAAGVLQRFPIDYRATGAAPPSFEELHSMVPWFFRNGKPHSWCRQMPPNLQDLFLKIHGDTLLNLGYPVVRSLDPRS